MSHGKVDENGLNVPRFALGRVVATPGALECLKRNGVRAAALLARHARGDWGDVPPEDWKENDLSVEAGIRILSSYAMAAGERVWVITEADRSATTLLLPQEY